MNNIKTFENFNSGDIYFYGGRELNAIDNLNGRYYFGIGDDLAGSIELNNRGGKFKDTSAYEVYLSSFGINDEFKGKGYGYLFFKMILDALKEKDVKYITLMVRYDNAPALKIYQKLGFIPAKELPEFKSKPPFNSETNLFLVKKNF